VLIQVINMVKMKHQLKSNRDWEAIKMLIISVQKSNLNEPKNRSF
jgi:hypothetical protein